MTRTIQIMSRNADYQVLTSYKQNREKRSKAKLCFVEGVHPIEQAIKNGFKADSFIFAKNKRLSGWANDMISAANPERLFALSDELMREISDREEASELIGIFHQRLESPEKLFKNNNPLVVVCDRPGSPGNLGAIIRSADALGASGLIVSGHACDIFDPLCIRASVGTVFAFPMAFVESHSRIVELAQGMKIVGTSAKAETYLSDCDFNGPTVLLIGNETLGLSKNYKDICDVLVRIPISGAASSLNAACAASICLYEVARQRG